MRRGVIIHLCALSPSSPSSVSLLARLCAAGVGVAAASFAGSSREAAAARRRLESLASAESEFCSLLTLARGSASVAPALLAQADAWGVHPSSLAVVARFAVDEEASEAGGLALLRAASELGCGAYAILTGTASVSAPSFVTFLSGLEDVPRAEARRAGASMVGVAMRAKRAAALAGAGMLPPLPVDGVCFEPLPLETPPAEWGAYDAILHKATDELEIVRRQEGSSSSSSASVFAYRFGPGIQALEAYLAAHPLCVCVDPLEQLASVIDRRRTAKILRELEEEEEEEEAAAAGKKGLMPRIRAPATAVLEDAESLLAQSNLRLPVILKPVAACGVDGSHRLAIVRSFAQEHGEFFGNGASGVVVAQEYVSHGDVFHKVYVLGDEIFPMSKPSTPAVPAGAMDGPPLVFDSLKPLPRSFPDSVASSSPPALPLDLALARTAAARLRAKLGLSLFGFDVVVETGSGDHFVVDVNYLPSFNNVPKAGEALRRVVAGKIAQQARLNGTGAQKAAS